MARPTAQKIASDAPHKEYVKLFLSHVTSISRLEGWSDYEAFVRWLEAGACALRNPVLTAIGDQARWDANEERYMAIVKQCRYPKETMTEMSRMLAVAQLSLLHSPSDFIGPVFSEIAASSHMGQFFTPSSVTQRMAKMTLHDAWGMLAKCYTEQGRSYLRLSDPACGVGGMVLASNIELKSQGFDVGADVHWVLQDVDWRAVCGAYIQCCLTDASAEIIHGDPLRLEQRDVLITPMAVRYPKYEPKPTAKLLLNEKLIEAA
jgi:hypothetical protein